MFIILNKTCFRGMYRVLLALLTLKNGFNVPFGHYKNTPSIISKIRLNNISNFIKDVEFIFISDIKTSVKNVKRNYDWLRNYNTMESPYYPINKQSFVTYSKDGFNKENHEELFDILIINKYFQI